MTHCNFGFLLQKIMLSYYIRYSEVGNPKDCLLSLQDSIQISAKSVVYLEMSDMVCNEDYSIFGETWFIVILFMYVFVDNVLRKAFIAGDQFLWQVAFYKWLMYCFVLSTDML